MKMKRILFFVIIVLLITVTVNACSTEFRDTSSSRQGAQVSKIENSYYLNESDILSLYESLPTFPENSRTVSEFIRAEIDPTIVTETGEDAPEGFKSVRITFMDSNLINVDMVVPENWTLKANNDIEALFGYDVCHPVTFIQDGKSVGVIFDSIYEDYGSDDYLSIYHYIRGNHFMWLEDYREVRKDDKSSAAISTLTEWWQATVSDDSQGVIGYYDEKKRDAIVSYNKDVLKYIGISIDKDLLTKQQLEIIAKNIVLSASN